MPLLYRPSHTCHHATNSQSPSSQEKPVQYPTHLDQDSISPQPLCPFLPSGFPGLRILIDSRDQGSSHIEAAYTPQEAQVSPRSASDPSHFWNISIPTSCHCLQAFCLLKTVVPILCISKNFSLLKIEQSASPTSPTLLRHYGRVLRLRKRGRGGGKVINTFDSESVWRGRIWRESCSVEKQ